MFEMESNTVIREFRPDVRIESDSFKVDSLRRAPHRSTRSHKPRGSVHEPRLVSLFSAKLYNDALDVEDSHTGMEAGHKIL